MATTEDSTEMTEIRSPDIQEVELIQEEETAQNADPAVLEVTKETEELPEEELPPLTYIDFLPQSFGSRVEGSDPVYASFQTAVEQANQWLLSMPQFSAVKCETVEHRVNSADFSQQPDTSLRHFSSHGRNVCVKGLRLWLMPRTDQTLPVQQLGYVTVLPDHSSGNLVTALSTIQSAAVRINREQVLNEFDRMAVTMEKLNHHLQQKPLPGRILTVETLCLKAAESDRTETFNTENTLWAESGKASRLFVFATRIFYVVGSPAFEKVYYRDQVPDIHQSPEDFGLRVKFAPFSQTVAQAAVWLAGQKDMRAVNFQSVTLKMERPGGVGPFRVDPEAAGFTESQGLQESRYVKVLRVFYCVKEPKAEPSPALRLTVRLTTRLFVPTKMAGARSFESFSKTVQRMITWLRATGTPVLGMETIGYPVNPDSEQGVSSERVDRVVSAFSGQYSLTCIRLYFPCEFQEPPPEVVPETEADYWGWACVVS